ncbi:MAG: hypothetical protein GQ583_01985 [Methyloprofundus sp.]|nr:hypothetical protein [Methyloprofundus sp.]
MALFKCAGLYGASVFIADCVIELKHQAELEGRHSQAGAWERVKQASEFKDLGVAVQKELPPELVSKANLELEVLTDEKE